MQRITTYTTLLLTLTITVGFTGCSGSRVRNLISRSDYKTLEEVQAQDEEAKAALASTEEESAEQSIVGRLVSRTKTKPSESEEAETSSDVKKFGLGRLFGKQDEELTPDPFASAAADTVTEDADTRATTVSAAKTEDAPETPTVSLEDQVEAMLQAAAEDGVNETGRKLTEAITETVEATPETSVSDAFGEFVAQQEAQLEAAEQLVQESTTAFTETAASVEESIQTPADEFDSILDAGTDSVSATTENLDSALFPDFDLTVPEPPAMVADAPAALFNELTENAAAPPVPPAPKSPPADVFDLAAEKHGFGSLSTGDPWAATDDDPVAQDVAEANDFSGDSAWSGQDVDLFAAVPDNDDSQEEMATTDEFEFDWGEPDADNAASFFDDDQPHFHQVSSSETTEVPVFDEAVNVSEEPQLVIPSSNDLEFSVPVPVSADTDTSGLQQTSAEVVTDGETVPGLPATESAAEMNSGSAKSAAIGTPTDRRSWYFGIGCLLIAALLFLPERQSRLNR